MSFRFEQFEEHGPQRFGSPPDSPSDSLATQINDKVAELGEDWVPVQVLGIETPQSEFADNTRSTQFLVFFITKDELAGEFGEIIAQFRSSFVGGKPTPL